MILIYWNVIFIRVRYAVFYMLSGVTYGMDTDTHTHAMTPDQLNMEDLMQSRDYFNQSQSSMQSHDMGQTTSDVRYSNNYVDSLEGTMGHDNEPRDPDTTGTLADGALTLGYTRTTLDLTDEAAEMSRTQDSDRMSRRLQPRIVSVPIPTMDQFSEDTSELSGDVSELTDVL